MALDDSLKREDLGDQFAPEAGVDRSSSCRWGPSVDVEGRAPIRDEVVTVIL